MFSQISRYRKLPDMVTQDKLGRSLNSKSLRLLPEVTGEIQHTVEEIDRLDHLAFKYYGQPRNWWRICDAHPDTLSPLALLGQEPIVTERFALTWDDQTGEPPWAALRQQLLDRVGVQDVQIEDEIQLAFETRVVDGQPVPVHVEQVVRAVMIIYNRMTLDGAILIEVLTALGFDRIQPTRISRVGKPITIPPNSVT